MTRLFFVSLLFLGMIFVFFPASDALAACGVNGSCLNANLCTTRIADSTPAVCTSPEVCCGPTSPSPPPTSGCPEHFTKKAGVCIPTNTGLAGLGASEVDNPISWLLTRVMNWLLGIIGVLAVIMFVISGIQYFSAAGDEKMAETAKRNMTYAIIGLAIALAGLIIVNAVAGLTGAGGVTNY